MTTPSASAVMLFPPVAGSTVCLVISIFVLHCFWSSFDYRELALVRKEVPELLLFLTIEDLLLMFHPLELQGFVFVDNGPLLFPGHRFMSAERALTSGVWRGGLRH